MHTAQERSVGWVLDRLAAQLHLDNVNNRADQAARVRAVAPAPYRPACDSRDPRPAPAHCVRVGSTWPCTTATPAWHCRWIGRSATRRSRSSTAGPSSSSAAPVRASTPPCTAADRIAPARRTRKRPGRAQDKPREKPGQTQGAARTNPETGPVSVQRSHFHRKRLEDGARWRTRMRTRRPSALCSTLLPWARRPPSPPPRPPPPPPQPQPRRSTAPTTPASASTSTTTTPSLRACPPEQAEVERRAVEGGGALTRAVLPLRPPSPPSLSVLPSASLPSVPLPAQHAGRPDHRRGDREAVARRQGAHSFALAPSRARTAQESPPSQAPELTARACAAAPAAADACSSHPTMSWWRRSTAATP